METARKTGKLETITLIIAGLWALFGLLYVAGSMVFSIGQDTPGDFLSAFGYVLFFLTVPLVILEILSNRHPQFKNILKPWHIVLVTIISIVIVTFGQFGQTYNYFTRANEALDKQYAAVDIIYQKRFDVIPNVAKVAKTFSDFEQGVVGQIADARKTYIQANSTNEKVQAANHFDSYIVGFVRNVENYPNLKSDALYLQVIHSINQNENDIVAAKNKYNDLAEAFNKDYKTFPYFLVVGFTSYKERTYLKADLGKEIYNSKTLLDNLKK